MPSPAKVSYIAPLNIVSKGDRNLHESSSTQSALSEDLLRRCNFDWAEDVEDAVADHNLPMNAIPKSLHYRAPGMSWYDEPFPTPNHVPTPRFQPSFSTLYEEVWDELWGWAHGTSDSASSSSKEAESDLRETTSASSSYDEPFHNDEFHREQLTPTADSDVYSVAQQSVDNIFADRQAWIEADEDLHHFNWMGVGTYTHSSTTPSHSLAIILAKPKNPQGSATWRILSLLNRAGEYIDPVLVLMDGTDNALFDLRGSELVRASTRRVFKFYSPHGTWLEDPSDSSEETTTDFGDVRTYDALDLAIGNGFVESSAIRSVSQWTASRNEACDASWGQPPQRKTWERKPSPLSQCQSILPETLPQAAQPETIKGAKKPPRKITTCVVGAPPEEYFSFPTPVFGRRKGIKHVFAKARKGLASMLTSLRGKFT
ncbi:hypothetical protein PEX2_088340 [Penicillium expansum]|uniref:Uncharacterized protein n=1 Tax=Penicillium expansum TaxID=27334 RepID=A0A0A2JYZ1_PENEN|nr:hypothetical protein PEX2_088340 [Penicillium expansum]KGO60652.1 hypothetical protein PEX2_088340 [Penicillium expansum]